MRHLTNIILHCSATPEGRWHDAADIRDWHVNGNGWSDIGYHYVVLIDGTIEEGRPLNRVGAHTKGHNKNSVGVCYIGGLDKDMNPKNTMTDAQQVAIEELVCLLRDEFGDDLLFTGHNEYSTKACPSFDVSEVFDYLQ